MRKVILLAFLAPWFCSAYTISQVRVSGEKAADILFEGSEMKLPVLRSQGNVLEASFPGAELSEALKEKKDITPNHPLIQRISIFPTEGNGVRARILVNGSTEGLTERAKLSPDPSGVRLQMSFPTGESTMLSVFQEEQLPLAVSENRGKAAATGTRYAQGMAILCILLVSIVGGVFLYRNLKKRGKIVGTRKYLIEQLSHCPLGNRTGVSLLKIGKEFVLVGITPHQVTFISALPKLQDQYESEATLERKDFRKVVEDEFKRIKHPLPA